MNTELNEVKTDFVICAEDGRCLLRIDLRAGKVGGSLGDMGEAARVFVEHVRAMLGASTAALSSPPADDVREALARIVEDNFEVEDEPHRTADAILAAFEVRPYGTVTDAEVEAALHAYQHRMTGSVREQMRAALEAAREARS